MFVRGMVESKAVHFSLPRDGPINSCEDARRVDILGHSSLHFLFYRRFFGASFRVLGYARDSKNLHLGDIQFPVDNAPGGNDE
jgi:hypothetical protein